VDWRDEYSEHLTDILRKLKRRDPYQYSIIRKKIDEVLLNPERYKPLRYDMKGFRRVHVLKSFVLIFKADIASKVVRFEDYDHHDNIYKKYR
jgi:YafQ family addiction module toxin component